MLVRVSGTPGRYQSPVTLLLTASLVAVVFLMLFLRLLFALLHLFSGWWSAKADDVSASACIFRCLHMFRRAVDGGFGLLAI